MSKLPNFLESIYSEEERSLDGDILAEKFHWLRQETRKIPTWNKETLNLFQKTYCTRNRYINKLPCTNDSSRVRLNPLRNPDKCDYINASFLNYDQNNMMYIASQAPISRTIGDFWQMISEQTVQVIVMLVLADGLKCDRYWPEKDEVFQFQSGIKISLLSVKRYSSSVLIRELRLEDGEECRKIKQYNFISWPDHDIPEIEPLMNFLEKLYSDPLYQSPVLVHCSAGVGRTGTFCVIDTIIRQLESGHQFVKDPVLDMTLSYRNQRTSIVETFVPFFPLSRCILMFFLATILFHIPISADLLSIKTISTSKYVLPGLKWEKLADLTILIFPKNKECIQPGISGVFVTCFRNVEAKCTSEVYFLLSQALEALNTKADLDSEEEDSKGLSFEEQIKSEVEGIKDRKVKPFLAVETKNLQCIVFVKAIKEIDTVELVEKLFDLIRERQIKSIKFSQRLLPIQTVCMAKIEDIRIEVSKLISSKFDSPTEYSVVFESRLNDSLDRMTVIDMIVEIVGPVHKVNLSKPQKVILVQIFKNHCGLAILDKWIQNRKYNLQETLKAAISNDILNK